MRKNGKITSLFFILILLFSGFSFVSSPPPGTPWTVDATVKDAITGSGIEGASVTITNLNTSESFTKVTGAGGYMLGDQLTAGVSEGDVIRAQATKGTGSGTSDHTVTATEEAGGGVTMNVIISYPLDVSLAVNHNQCAGTATFTATATGGDGNYTYDWDKTGDGTVASGGGTSDATMVITGPGTSGSVTLTVDDDSGNQDSDSAAYSLNDELIGNSNWEAECDTDVRFTVNASGGTPPYTYSIDINCDGEDYNSGQTSNTSATIYAYGAGWDASGTWCWSVTDSCSNEVTGGPINWAVPTKLDIQLTQNVENHCDGTVELTVAASGGTGPYTYEWDADNNGTYELSGQTSRTFDVGYGASGTINARVTDDCNNTDTVSFSYDLNDEVTVQITSVQYNCAYTEVTFTAQAQGGSGSYIYTWDTDEDGNFDDGTGTTKTITPGVNQTGTVSVKAVNNAGSVGILDMVVDDGNGCEDTDSADYDTTYTPLDATGDWGVNCSGELVLQIDVTGGTADFTFEFDYNNDGTIDHTETAPEGIQHKFTPGWGTSGQWSWKVTDHCNEFIEGGPTAWTIPGELDVQITSWNENHCTGEVTLTATATGGTGPYQYDWDADDDGVYEISNGGATRTFDVGYDISNSINVKVIDDCSNDDFASYQYDIYPQLSFDISQVTVSCNHESVTFKTSVTGGSGNFRYDWDLDGDGSYEVVDGSDEQTINPGINQTGTVNAKITDTTTSCVDTDTANYDTTYTPLGASGSSNVNCSGELELTIAVTGGNAPYRYEFDYNDDGTVDWREDSSDLSVTHTFSPGWGASGDWSWDVTDMCAEVISGQAESWQIPAQLDVQITSSDVDQCAGEVVLTATATGGTGPYQYDWDADDDGVYEIEDGGATRTFDVGYDISNSINVKVIDDCSNEDATSFQYSINPQLSVDIISKNISCNHETVTFTASAQGGDGNFTYSWDIDGDGYNDGTGTEKTINPGIDQQGTVLVKVVDGNGCVATDGEGYDTSYTALTASGSWDWNCDGDLVLTIDVTGGTPNYAYEFDYDNDGTFDDGEQATPNLSVSKVFDSDWDSSGQWSWKVTDNCSEFVEGGPTAWDIPSELDIQWSSVVVNHCDGTVTFTAEATGGSGNYRYDWDMNGDSTYELTNGGPVQILAGYDISGTVNVMATDISHGCTDTISQNYQVNPQLLVDLVVVVDHCAGEATFTATATGGDGNYTYDWDMDGNGTYEIIGGGAQRVVAGIGIDGTVNVRANDTNCTAMDSQAFSINPELSLNLNVTYGDGVANFTAEGNGGGENYVYDWDMNNDGTYEIIDGGQTQTLNGYGNQGIVGARVTDLCPNQADATVSYAIPDETVEVPPENVYAKGIFELDGVTPHSGSASYLVMWYPDNNADTYVVEESLSPSFAVITNSYTTLGTQKKYINKADGTYYYRAKGCNEAGCTPWSSTMVATVGDAIVLPESASDLQAVAVSQTAISLSWNDNSDNETGFKVYRNGTLIATLGVDALTYLDEGLECGSSYTYFVRSYNGDGNAPASNIAHGTTESCPLPHQEPETPTNANATGISETEVELSWIDQSNDETGFEVYRNGTMVADLSSNTTGYVDTGLDCETTYSYYVVAYNNYGSSDASNSADATTDQCPPQTTTPAPGDEFVRAELFSPAYLHALDAQGRHIGRIGPDQVEIEIPGGTYSGIDSHPQIITVYNPQSEIQFYFEAYEEGTVTLNVESNENGTTEQYSFKDLSVQEGSVFLVNGSVGTGQLDIDGDGVYEQEISGIMIEDEEDKGSNTVMYAALIVVILLIALAGYYLTSKKD